MSAPLPDKWVRKAIYDRIHNIDVNFTDPILGVVVKTIPCYDTRVSSGNPKFYILLTTQTNVQTNTKCGAGWDSSILIDIVTRYSAAGNTGSRVFAEDIAQEVLTQLDDLNLAPASTLKINNIYITFPADFSSVTSTENIFRKLIRYELTIN